MDEATKSGGRRLLLAVGLMAMAAFLNALDSVIVRVVAQELHPFVIGFFRGFFGLLFVLPWMLGRRGVWRSSYRVMHAVRAGLKLLSLVAFFMAIAAAPLADVTAIMFMSPIFVTAGAWLFLGERLRANRVVAVLLGFAGALVVAQPGQSGVSLALGLALLGAALQAVIQIMLKAMSRHDAPETLVAWNLLLTAPLAVIPAAFFWTTPSLSTLGLLALQGAIGAVNMSGVTKAFSLAEASVIAPIDFLRLPFAAILAFAFFGEVAGVNTWIGAGIIFGATLLTQGALRFRRRRGG